MAVLVGSGFSEAVQRELKTAFALVFGGYVQQCNAKDVRCRARNKCERERQKRGTASRR
jgi:hypothetical protein